jgi:hypothetical protein
MGKVSEWMKAGATGAVAGLLLNLVVGSAPASADSLMPSSAAVEGDRRVSVLSFRSVYAAFEVSYGQYETVYTVDIGGVYDVFTGSTAAQARGEVDGEEDLYYFAYGESKENQLVVNDQLNHAVLEGVVVVQHCFDKAGSDVPDPRCPVGEEIRINATFTSDQPMEKLIQRYEGGFNRVRGRIASATGAHGDQDIGPSVYGSIVENLTVRRALSVPSSSFQ